MSLPVVFVLTASNCGHCVKTRGDGSIGSAPPKNSAQIPGGYSWNVSFFRKVLTANVEGKGPAKVRVVEIHMADLRNPTLPGIKEFSEIQLDGDSIRRITMTRGETKNGVEANAQVREAFKGEVKTHHANQKFSQLISEVVPADISHYAYAYPSWGVASGANWDAALRGGKLYAIISGFQTIEDLGSYRLDPRSSAPAYDPVTLAAKAVSGQLQLNPKPTEPIQNDNVVIPTLGCRHLGYEIVSFP